MKLEEKLQTLYLAYAKSLSLGNDFATAYNNEYNELAVVLLNVHGAYLTQRDADVLTFRSLFEIEQRFEGRRGQLNVTENLDVATAAAEKLRETFASLPRKYILRVELPSFPNVGEYSVEITDHISLVATKHGFHPHQAHLHPIAAALSASGPGELKTFLMFELEGYAHNSIASPLIDACFSKLKQLAFVLCAYAVWHRPSLRSHLARATLTTQGTNRTQDVELPHELAKMCGTLTPHPDNLKVWVASKTNGVASLLVGEDKPAESNDEKIEAIKSGIRDGTKFFARSGHEDFPSICAAMEWHQDSVDSGNQTFAYLAACIGLEALLGSPDENLDTLSKRLEDRYAFLMGTGRSDRERLRQQYRRVLNLRGKLVHAREQKLKEIYRPTLNEVQNMLLHATWKELHNMYKSK